jgi:DHA2 family multidrug resistance protein
MGYYIQHEVGSTAADALKMGQSLIFSHVTKQAFIQGVDDDFLVAGLITILGAIPIFWLHIKKKSQNGAPAQKPVPVE